MAINRVTIMGNLTRDAELRKKGDAASVLTFGLAINEKKKDTETGEYVDAPVFVDCALFGARAEALAPYLTKGKKVSVDGRLRYHSWMKNEEKIVPTGFRPPRNVAAMPLKPMAGTEEEEHCHCS